MNKTYLNLLLPDGDYSPEVQDALAKMEELCASFATSENQKDLYDALHSLYWQVMIGIIPSYVDEKNKEKFELPHAIYPWINYGLVSAAVCPDYPETPQPEEAVAQEKHPLYDEYTVIYFNEWIERMHKRAINYEQKLRFLRRLEKARTDASEYPARLSAAFQQREDFVTRYPSAHEVKKVSEEIDKRLPAYTAIKEKIELSQRITTEERIRYVQLTEELSNLRDLRAREQQAIADKVPQPEMMRIDRAVESTILLKGILDREVENAEKAVKEDEEWRSKITIAMCRETIREDIRRTRTMIELAARRSHTKPLSVLIEYKAIPTPKQIVDAIEDILEVDPTLVAKGGRHRDKFPSILVVPIFGDGIYDFEKNVLLIPTRSPKGLTQAVATALIEYHLESESGNTFKESYLKLREGEGIYSSIKLRERMLRDYIAWVTLEAKGYQVLDQKTKQWFLENLAPTMFSLKFQRRLGDFTVAEGHEIIKAHEAHQPDDPKEYTEELRVGIAYWRIGLYEQANQAFSVALNINPESQDACYNVALSCFKLGLKQKAIEYWRAYLRLDKMSFWTVRVQKFLSTVR